MKLSIKDFFSKCDQIQFPANLVTFTEEILIGKLHFLCSVVKTTVFHKHIPEILLLNHKVSEKMAKTSETFTNRFTSNTVTLNFRKDLPIH